MNDTKKKVFLKIAGLMAILMMLTTCIISGTMAKYTSSGSGTLPNFSVAKWDIKVNNDSTFSTPLSALSWTIEPIKTEASDPNNAVKEKKIAPGTWGYAEIKIENTGEVDATLTVSEITVPESTSSNLSFGFKYTTSSQNTYEGMNGGTNASNLSYKLTKSGGVASTVYLYIYYKWDYDVVDGGGTNDTQDTTIGTNTNEFTFTKGTLTITATQVEPDKGTAGD